MPKQYPEEFKKQGTAICLAGTPFAIVSKKYHISLNTLYRWCKEYQQTGDQSTTKDYLTLCRQHELQSHILQIIRLSNIIDDVSRRKRLEIPVRLYEQFEQYSVHELCEALNISRGHFTTTFSARQIEQSICRDSRKSCCKYSKSLMAANSVSGLKRYGHTG